MLINMIYTTVVNHLVSSITILLMFRFILYSRDNGCYEYTDKIDREMKLGTYFLMKTT